MRYLTNSIARTALIVAVATATLVNSLAQEPRYGLYIGDRDTYRVITYLQPTYDPSAGDGWDIALMLRWSCAYSQFAKGYQSNPLEQVYIYGIAVDHINRRIWASDHLRHKVVVFDRDGRYIADYSLPPGVSYPRKMAISSFFGRSYLYVSASGKLWVFGPIDDLSTPSWQPFIDADTNEQVDSYSGVRFNRNILLVSASTDGKAVAYKLDNAFIGYRNAVWDEGGEDIDYIDDDTILLARPGGRIRKLSLYDTNITDFITGLPGGWQGIAVGPQEVDDTRFIYIATYETFPNALIVYRYNPNASDDEEQLQWFGAASPLPFKSGYAVAIGPVWDCSQCTNRCPEDVNGDRVVDDADLLRILFAFGTTCGN